MALTERQTARKAWLINAITAIESAQLNSLTSEAAQMTFNGRSIQRFSPQELERLRTVYDGELSKLEKVEAGTYTRTVRVIG